MSTPFQLVWTDISGNVLTESWFPIGFPNTTSISQQIQLRSNAIALQTYETLKNVKVYLTGDPSDIDIVQNLWPTMGGANKPELNGGYEISFDFGRTYVRFNRSIGFESDPKSWILLPSQSIGIQGINGVLGAFDTAHFIVRVIVPPGAIQYGPHRVGLALDFDII